MMCTYALILTLFTSPFASATSETPTCETALAEAQRKVDLQNLLKSHGETIRKLIDQEVLSVFSLPNGRITPFKWAGTQYLLLRIPNFISPDSSVVFEANRVDQVTTLPEIMANFVPHRDVLVLDDEIAYLANSFRNQVARQDLLEAPRDPAGVALVIIHDFDMFSLAGTLADEEHRELLRDHAEVLERYVLSAEHPSPAELIEAHVNPAVDEADGSKYAVLTKGYARGSDISSPVLAVLNFNDSYDGLRFALREPRVLLLNNGQRVRVQFEGDRLVFGWLEPKNVLNALGVEIGQ